MSKSKQPAKSSYPPLCDMWGSLGKPDVLNTANNCYSYAVASVDAITDIRHRAHAEATPQPGDASGTPKNILLLMHYRSLAFWLKLTERDGLKYLPTGKGDPLPDLPEGQRLVALCYVPKTGDYHWMRREQDGNWSQKPDSRRPPTRYDSQRQLITDPRTAHLTFAHSDFVFMAAPTAGIDVRMKKNWLKFFNSLDDATYGNYSVLRHRLIDLAALVQKDFVVLGDYLKDLSANGDDTELKKFWQHLRTGKRLPNADGLLPLAQAHAPLGLAWQAVTR